MVKITGKNYVFQNVCKAFYKGGVTLDITERTIRGIESETLVIIIITHVQKQRYLVYWDVLFSNHIFLWIICFQWVVIFGAKSEKISNYSN